MKVTFRRLAKFKLCNYVRQIHTRKLINIQVKDMASNKKEQLFKYLLILDFEATCDKKAPLIPQEIIEFPVIKLNTSTLESEAVFHTYVEPDVHPRLTPFCTEVKCSIHQNHEKYRYPEFIKQQS
ncbi:ERI1 exoribonuclease 3-like [Saccostrea cucullata]|uniref:ERI1 exoribonuclease 3-like n=1 Tax=Saccostrea cuccullata TaxID=36930 RepID=UPI002ED42C08